MGDIYINYFRNRITRVGDLRVSYNRWGAPKFYGNIRNYYFDNGIRFNVSYGDVCNFNDPFFFKNDFRRNYTQFREESKLKLLKLTLKVLEEIVILLIEKTIIAVIYLMIKPKNSRKSRINKPSK